MLILPLIAPACREHTTMELWTVLGIKRDRNLTRRYDSATYILTQEWEDESWERQPALYAVFEKVLITITL